jgi:hypothetical protein
MGNYSRDPQQTLNDALDLDYVRVRFQQGKPVIDRELNLAADLVSPQRLVTSYLGAGVAGVGGDFAISALNIATNDFTIAPGRALVGGLQAVLRAATTYRTQPNRGAVAALPAGTSNVYLRVFEREVTAADDPALGNPGDVTFETAVRSRVDWEVLVSAAPINLPTHLLLAVLTTAPATVTDRRRVGLNLAAATDELQAARGTTASLGARLGASLAPSGTLAPAVVGNAQLLPQAVSTDRIAPLAVTQDRLAPGSVGVPQLRRTIRFSGSVTLSVGAEISIVAFAGPAGTANRHATMLTSVIASGAQATVSWREFATQALVGAALQFSRGIRLRHEAGAALTVDIELSELSPT